MGKDIVKDVDKDHEALSLEQKLFLVDQEIRTLHQCCVNQGYTPLQIHQVCTLEFRGEHFLFRSSVRFIWLLQTPNELC